MASTWHRIVYLETVEDSLCMIAFMAKCQLLSVYTGRFCCGMLWSEDSVCRVYKVSVSA